MELKIKDLEILNYKLDTVIQNGEKIGVYSTNKEVIDILFDLISGINNNNDTILIDEQNVFDNQEYMNTRLYFDFSKSYLTTLRVSTIKEALTSYNLELDKEKFVRILNELNIRGETDITYKYEFTKTGNVFVNLALISSLGKDNIIVKHTTSELKLENDIEYFVAELTSNKFKNVILDIDNIIKFKNKLDKVILFSDYNEVYVLNNKDSFIVFDTDIDKHFLIKNKLFKGNKLIALNTYNKDELKNFQKLKVPYEIISIYDFDKYLGEV